MERPRQVPILVERLSIKSTSAEIPRNESYESEAKVQGGDVSAFEQRMKRRKNQK